MSRISKVITKDDGKIPVLLNYENGSVLPKNSNSIKCGYFNDTSNGNDYIVSSTDEMIYKGEVESFQNTTSLLAIRNKVTNKIRLIEISKCTLLPILQESLNTSHENKSRMEMLSMLNKTFGSKRAKRQTELRERMAAVNTDEIKEQLEKTIQTAIVNPEDLKVITEADALSAFLPPLHRDATSVDQVFILSELINSEILEALNTVSEQMLVADAEQISANGFVRERILELQKSNSSTRIQVCSVLLYVDSLINYFTASYREISKKQFAPCPHSIIVNKQILNTFSMLSANGRTRPNSMRDKTLAYIIALSLLVSGYKILVEDISKVLKLNAKKVLDIARVIGVTQTKVQAGATLVLKLPLPAPTSGVFKGRKKGK